MKNALCRLREWFFKHALAHTEIFVVTEPLCDLFVIYSFCMLSGLYSAVLFAMTNHFIPRAG